MPSDMDKQILSSVQLILPKNVIDTCYSLKQRAKATFLATNGEQRTQTEIKVKRQIDESIRLCVRVIAVCENEVQQESIDCIVQDKKNHDNENENKRPLDNRDDWTIKNSLQESTIKSSNEEQTAPSHQSQYEHIESTDLNKFGEGLPPKMRRKCRRLSVITNNDNSDPMKNNQLDPTENGMTNKPVNSEKPTEIPSYVEPIDSCLEQKNIDTDKMDKNEDQNKTIDPMQEKEEIKCVSQNESFVNCSSNAISDSFESNTQSKVPPLETVPSSFENIAAVGPFAKKKMRERNVQCKLCDSMLKSYDMLNIHVRRQHQQNRNFRTYLKEIWLNMKAPCPICKKMLSSKNHIKSHIRFKHPEQAVGADVLNTTNTPISETSSLPNKRTRKSTYKAMKLASSNTKVNNAKDINKKNKDKMKGKPGRKKKQMTKSDLEAQEQDLIQHAEQTQPVNNEFQCKVCDKLFPLRRQLQRHIWIHMEPRFQCRLCDRKFTARDNMAKHIIRMHQADPSENIIVRT